MSATGKVNDQTVVHKDSGGQVVTVDVCLTPMGNTMVPVPYTNIAKSADTTNGSKKLNVDGNPIMLKDSKFAVSSGDSPGKAGVGSGTVKGWAKFTNYSADTFVEGRPVCRRDDPMISNNGNTPPAALQQANMEVEKVKAIGTHVLSAGLVFKYVETVHGGKLVRLSFLYTISPPPNPEEKKDGKYLFRSIEFNDAVAGEYELKIEMDKDKKEIPYKEAAQ